jgi:hypothetical protein
VVLPRVSRRTVAGARKLCLDALAYQLLKGLCQAVCQVGATNLKVDKAEFDAKYRDTIDQGLI